MKTRQLVCSYDHKLRRQVSIRGQLLNPAFLMSMPRVCLLRDHASKPSKLYQKLNNQTPCAHAVRHASSDKHNHNYNNNKTSTYARPCDVRLLASGHDLRKGSRDLVRRRLNCCDCCVIFYDVSLMRCLTPLAQARRKKILRRLREARTSLGKAPDALAPTHHWKLDA